MSNSNIIVALVGNRATVGSSGRIYSRSAVQQCFFFCLPLEAFSALRNVTIPRELCDALREYADGGEYVFHTRNGGVWNTHNVERAWRAILDKAEVQRKHFHALRHTHATQLLANYVPLIEVSRRLGHSKPSITLDLYGHAIPGYDKKIPEKVQAIFNFDGHSMGTTLLEK